MSVRPLLAEFIGTFTLIFIGAGAMAVSTLAGVGSGLVGIALAHGLAIAVMVSATVAVSGGHLNPAVTFGAYLARKLDGVSALGYVIAQCLGGIAAAAILKIALPAALLESVKMGTPALGADVTVTQGLVMEIILTFFLVFVVFGTAIDRRAPKVGGLFIGLAVALGVLIGGPISGAAMNPARHLGPALLGGGLQHLWLYWIGPLVGGGLAALVYHHGLEELS